VGPHVAERTGAAVGVPSRVLLPGPGVPPGILLRAAQGVQGMSVVSQMFSARRLLVKAFSACQGVSYGYIVGYVSAVFTGALWFKIVLWHVVFLSSGQSPPPSLT
jgi:hypothetical protein